MLLAAAVLATLTSGLSIEDAKARIAQIKGDITRPEAENIFGKPLTMMTLSKDTYIQWMFYMHSLALAERGGQRKVIGLGVR